MPKVRLSCDMTYMGCSDYKNMITLAKESTSYYEERDVIKRLGRLSTQSSLRQLYPATHLTSHLHSSVEQFHIRAVTTSWPIFFGFWLHRALSLYRSAFQSETKPLLQRMRMPWQDDAR